MRAERERIAEEIIDRKRRNSGNSPGQSSSRIRDVAAEEDGNIACFESEKLVLDNRDRYVECECCFLPPRFLLEQTRASAHVFIFGQISTIRPIQLVLLIVP